MESKQVETSGSRKARVSKGKLKKSANRKGKRQSQGFSSSFTQKTLRNNTLLAQSLAKEKSRNEKFLVLHRELMTSRNEALMRLNETEASFDRLGVLVQKGIRQMQEVASTMGEVYAEIRASKNNPRDSASMRSSWDETVTSAGRTMMKQSLPHMNGMQDNVGMNDQSPQWPLCRPSLPVTPIEEEELETTCSDDDTLREDSLVCRRAPTSRQPTHECFGGGASALDGEGAVQPTRPVRKVPRGVTKLPGHDFSSTPSWLEDDTHDRTSLSLVDMDETVVHGVAQNAEAPCGQSFNTVTGGRVDEESPEDLSYEGVFCVPPRTDESQMAAKGNALPDRTSGVDCATRHVVPGADRESSDRETPARTDSPDFLGFSNENVDWPNQVASYDAVSLSSNEEGSVTPNTYDFFGFPTVNPASPKKRLHAKSHSGTSSTVTRSKSPRLLGLVGISTGDGAVSQKKIHNKSPNIVQNHSKSSSTGHPNPKSSKVKASSTSLAPAEIFLNSDPSKEAIHNSKQSRPKLTKRPSLSKSPDNQHAIDLEQSNDQCNDDLPKSSAASLKHSTFSPTKTINGGVPSKHDAWDLPTTASLKTPSAPDARTTISIEVSATRLQERTRSPSLLPSKSPARNKSAELPVDDAVIGSRLHTRSVSETGKGGQRGQTNLRTPGSLAAGETPSEIGPTSRSVSGSRHDTGDVNRSREKPKRGKPKRGRHKRVSAGDDVSETPSRGPEAKTRKLVVMLHRLDDSQSPGCRWEDSLSYSASSASEQDAADKRTRRRVVPANYKEPLLNTKIRRPVSKDNV